MDDFRNRSKALTLCALAALALASCTAPSSTSPGMPTTTPPELPTATPIVTPVATPAMTEPPAMRFPSESGVPLEPGRYSSSPPFEVTFTFDIADPGWESAHIHGEFFDIMRFDDPDSGSQPSRWIAFAHPTMIRGAQDTPVDGMSPDEAAGLLSGRQDLAASPAEPFELGRLQGVRLDLHADAQGTVAFGGPAGNFGLQPEYDVRLGVLQLGRDLLLVLVLAPPPELGAAWAEAQPILASVDL